MELKESDKLQEQCKDLGLSGNSDNILVCYTGDGMFKYSFKIKYFYSLETCRENPPVSVDSTENK